MNPGVVVHEDYVIVEYKDVYDEHGKLHQECHKEANESRRLCFLIIVEKLEQITV